MNSQMPLINVLNQAAVAQSSFRAVAVPQDQRQCSKHFGPRISISLLQLTHPSAISLPLLKKTKILSEKPPQALGLATQLMQMPTTGAAWLSHGHRGDTTTKHGKPCSLSNIPPQISRQSKVKKKVSKHVASAGSTGPPR